MARSIRSASRSHSSQKPASKRLYDFCRVTSMVSTVLT
jgi:hypothetical protein